MPLLTELEKLSNVVATKMTALRACQSDFTDFENVTRVVIHVELFKQLDVFLLEGLFGVMLLLVLNIMNDRAKLGAGIGERAESFLP